MRKNIKSIKIYKETLYVYIFFFENTIIQFKKKKQSTDKSY